MPPRIKFSREEVLRAAFKLTRERGAENVNARAIAGALGCSTQPLFREFESMEQIKREVLLMAQAEYERRIKHSASATDKPYKSAGLAYILFAKEEPELFKILFMRESESEGASRDASADYVLSLVERGTGFSPELAREFHLRLWIFVHGLASMVATRYVSIAEEALSALLSDEYEAMLALFKSRA